MCWKNPLLDPARLSCMSGSYCNDESRKLILQTLAWSFNCLSTFAASGFHMLARLTMPNSFYLVNIFVLGLGSGLYPYDDPWGRSFTKDYCKSRWALRGQPIAGGYRAILEGIQGDQDFIRILFSPSRDWNWFLIWTFAERRMVQKLYGDIFLKLNWSFPKFVIGMAQPPKQTFGFVSQDM